MHYIQKKTYQDKIINYLNDRRYTRWQQLTRYVSKIKLIPAIRDIIPVDIRNNIINYVLDMPLGLTIHKSSELKEIRQRNNIRKRAQLPLSP
jgi:hypothetical protein